MILVTGGAGYIGSHFIKLYTERNPNEMVLVVDNLSRGHRESLQSFNQVKLIECDIGNQTALDKVFSDFQIDTVFHFSGFAYVGESEIEPFRYFKNNVMQSLQLFEIMDKYNVRKIVFSSSCTTYGEPTDLPMKEDHLQKPSNVYGATKLIIEQVLRSLEFSSGWSSIILRYFNAAGADKEGVIGASHDPETRLIPNILKAAIKQETLKVYGTDYATKDGTCVRDYTHVTDLAHAHLLALDLLRSLPGAKSEMINLGTAKGTSVLEAIRLCELVTGTKINWIDAHRRPGDPANLIADCTKAEKLLNWQAKYDLKEIIETAWHWQRNKRY